MASTRAALSHAQRQARRASPRHWPAARLLLGTGFVLAVLAASVWSNGDNPGRAQGGPPASISGLHVVGNQIYNSLNQPVRLRGVNRGAAHACVQGWGIFHGPTDAAAVQAMAAWKINVVRIPLNEDCWLGINGITAAYAGANYRYAVIDYVNLLNQYGIAVILDLHWNAPGAFPATDQQ